MRITDALDRARAIRRDSAAPIDIQVGPGVYVGSYTNTGSTIEPLPIRLDVSHLKLIGTTKMEKDESGLPTGVIKSNSNTLLLADPPLEGMRSILALSSPNVTVENLSFDAGSGHGGWVVRVDQVQDFTLVNNYVTGGNTDSAMGIHVSRSSGKILGNYVTRGGCGICIVADDVSSPARFELTFANNQIHQNTHTPALISFTRFTASNTPAQLNPFGNAQSFKYVESSFYDLTYFNGELDGYWFDNPETDPVDGRVLNNVLRIHGNEIHSGRFIPYSH